jgi:hypothetical protein
MVVFAVALRKPGCHLCTVHAAQVVELVPETIDRQAAGRRLTARAATGPRAVSPPANPELPGRARAEAMHLPVLMHVHQLLCNQCAKNASSNGKGNRHARYAQRDARQRPA